MTSLVGVERGEEGKEREESKRGRRDNPSASSEKATHVEGAKAIFSGRQISPGPPTSAPRRRSLGYLISGCTLGVVVYGSRSTKPRTRACGPLSVYNI